METGQGRSTRRSVLGAYVKRLLQDTDLARPLNVVWDPGNGAACPVVERLVRAIPGRHVVLNGEVDGEFPGHHPDPTLPETLEQLRREVHRSEEHTSELQSLMRISYAVFCLKNNTTKKQKR